MPFPAYPLFPTLLQQLNWTEPNTEIRAVRPDVIFVFLTAASGRCKKKRKKKKKKQKKKGGVGWSGGLKSAPSLDLGLILIR